MTVQDGNPLNDKQNSDQFEVFFIVIGFEFS